MSLNVLVDLNLSPDWLHIFHAAGWSASHWSAMGEAKPTFGLHA